MNHSCLKGVAGQHTTVALKQKKNSKEPQVLFIIIVKNLKHGSQNESQRRYLAKETFTSTASLKRPESATNFLPTSFM